MIKVSVLHPNREGGTFDMKYFCESHIPMVQNKFGAACRGVSVDQGLAGSAPGTPPPFVAMAHFLFDSIEALRAAFGPHAAAIMGDVPNFAAVQPTIQISEVKI